jgi:4-amino-4-deoxy-L-arabinose transferase-like glycosyltransferase
MNCKDFILNNYIKILLFLIIFLQFLQLYYWINTHDINPAFDEAWHLSNTLYYQRFFSDLHVSSQDLASHYPIFGYAFNYYNHPNLFYIVSSFLSLDYPQILYINLLFLTILIIGVYSIGSYLFDKNVGLFAAFLISVFPLTLGLSRNYLLDLPLASIVVIEIYLLLKSVNFSDKKYTYLFILFFLIGITLKRSFLIFVLPLIIYYLIKFFRNKYNINYKKYIIFMIFLSFIFIYYNFWNFLEVISRFFNFSFKIDNFLEYFNLLISELSFFLFFIVLVALVLYLKKPFKSKIILFMATPIFIFYLLDIWFESRYTLPYFYVFALIIAKGFFSIKNNFLRKFLIFIVIIISLVQFISISYGIDLNQKSFKIGSDSFTILKKDLSKVYFSSFEKGKDRIVIPVILNIVNSSVIDSSRICIIAHSTQFNDINLPFYAIYHNYNFNYMVGNGCNPLNYDFILYKPFNNGSSFRIPSFLNSEKFLFNNLDNFELISNFSNSEFIYKRKAL